MPFCNFDEDSSSESNFTYKFWGTGETGEIKIAKWHAEVP